MGYIVSLDPHTLDGRGAFHVGTSPSGGTTFTGDLSALGNRITLNDLAIGQRVRFELTDGRVSGLWLA